MTLFIARRLQENTILINFKQKLFTVILLCIYRFGRIENRWCKLFRSFDALKKEENYTLHDLRAAIQRETHNGTRFNTAKVRLDDEARTDE